jgi:hypothetical protein
MSGYEFNKDINKIKINPDVPDNDLIQVKIDDIAVELEDAKRRATNEGVDGPNIKRILKEIKDLEIKLKSAQERRFE